MQQESPTQPLSPASTLRGVLVQHGDRKALGHRGHGYSYRWLLEHADALARLLQQKTDGVVALCLHNRPESLLTYLACGFSGHHLCAINPRFHSAELIAALKQVDAKVVIIEAGRVDRALQDFLDHNAVALLTVGDDSLDSDCWGQLDRAAAAGPVHPLVPDPIIYHLTSGTLGRSKIMGHRLSQILEYAKNRSEDLGYRSDDQLLVALSLNHAFAFSFQLLPAWMLGLPLVLIPTYADDTLDAILDALVQHPITSMAILPAMSHRLAERYSAQPRGRHRLRFVMVAGDQLMKRAQRLFERAFGVPLYQGIGMTEVYGYAQNTPQHHRSGATGKLFPTTEVKVDRIEELCDGPHDVGELLVRNEVMPLRLSDAQRADQPEPAPSWVKTGDIGYVDDDRFVFWLGRRKSLIVKDGSNITPSEIEMALCEHPEVLQAVVVGVFHPIAGEHIEAHVVCRQPQRCDQASLTTHLSSYLSAYKLPDAMVFHDRLPSNATGKPDRNALRTHSAKLRRPQEAIT